VECPEGKLRTNHRSYMSLDGHWSAEKLEMRGERLFNGTLVDHYSCQYPHRPFADLECKLEGVIE
jgi:hypothetical protein